MIVVVFDLEHEKKKPFVSDLRRLVHSYVFGALMVCSYRDSPKQLLSHPTKSASFVKAKVVQSISEQLLL